MIYKAPTSIKNQI